MPTPAVGEAMRFEDAKKPQMIPKSLFKSSGQLIKLNG